MPAVRKPPRTHKKPTSVMAYPLLALAFVSLTCACARPDQPTATGGGLAVAASTPARADAQSLSRAQRPTPASLIRALAHSGLAVPSPADVTSTCRPVGCIQSIVTDTVQLTSFPTPDTARAYANAHGLRSTSNIVATFPSGLSEADRGRYWAAIADMLR